MLLGFFGFFLVELLVGSQPHDAYCAKLFNDPASQMPANIVLLVQCNVHL